VSERQGGDGAPDESDDGSVLPEQTSDDTDRGWGDDHDDGESDDERLIREKPPHW
jgi:hypothetical protein